ncbi:TetR/AcrR family transcriptional regulator [soil metagenome]
MNPDRSRHGIRHSDDELLDGARSVFLEHGYHEVTMDEIAAAAGASKPTFYNHFGDKEEVYRRLMQRETDDLGQIMGAARLIFGDQPPRMRIRMAIASFFDWAEVEPDGFSLLFSDFQTEIAWEIRNAFVTRIREQFGRGIRENAVERSGVDIGESAEVIASMCISLVVGGAHRAGLTTGGMAASAELVSSFVEQALTNLDLRAVAPVEALSH